MAAVGSGAGSLRERWRRALLVLGVGGTAFGVMHHLDHVVRGNHSGWPFTEEVTRRYGEIMPYWMPSVIVACLPVLSRGRAGFLPALLGTFCFFGMLASTALGNIPINNRVLELSPETDGEELAELRERWDRLHTLRVVLNVAGLALLCLGALRGDEPKERRER